jgi:hypothetical protein
MVIVFAVGFAFLGVGSGGLDLASLVQSVFGHGGGGTSVSKAQRNAAKHPNEPQAWKNLADALQAHGRTAEEISALEHYIRLVPKDVTQLQNLAQIEVTEATSAQQANLAARQDQASVANATFFAPRLGGNDPITNALETQVSNAERDTFSSYRAAVQRALGTLKRLAKVENDAASYEQLATAAEQYNEIALALKAFRTELRLEHDPQLKAQIRARIKALRSAGPIVGG